MTAADPTLLSKSELSTYILYLLGLAKLVLWQRFLRGFDTCGKFTTPSWIQQIISSATQSQPGEQSMIGISTLTIEEIIINPKEVYENISGQNYQDFDCGGCS